MRRLTFGSVLLFLLLSSAVNGQNLLRFPGVTYNPFFSVTLEDRAGEVYRLNRVVFRDRTDQEKYFFWVMREVPGGMTTLPLSFEKIRSLTFEDTYDPQINTLVNELLLLTGRPEPLLETSNTSAEVANPSSNTESDSEVLPVSPDRTFVGAILELTSGETFDIYVDVTGSLTGMDAELGSYVSLYANYNILRSLRFEHQGTYTFCPFCSSIFYQEELESCPFDGTNLEPQLP